MSGCDRTKENIRVISGRLSRLAEAQVCEISALADAAVALLSPLVADGMGICELLSYLSDYDIKTAAEPTVLIEDNRTLIRSFARLADTAARAAFSSILNDRISSVISAGVGDFLPHRHKGGQVCYVKNALSDEAYDVFSENIDEPTVFYVRSFSEAVKAVLNADAEYCILPLEEKGGTRIPTVGEMIYRNDLKISAVTPVFGFVGTADLRFSLISTSFTIPERGNGDDMYLEIRLDGDCADIADIVNAAGCLGISVFRIGTQLCRTEDGDTRVSSLVFREDGGSFAAFLTYLTLFAPSCAAVGVYKNLE